MFEWFEFASPLERTFAFCAIAGAVLFVVRMGLQLFGGDAENGGDLAALAESGEATASFQFLSLHTINVFLLMFGLVGLAMRIENQAGEVASILAASAAGFGAMAVVGWLMFNLRKLQTSGNIQLRNAIGHIGDVYLTIPADGSGQVRVTFQGRLQIVDALCKSHMELKTGERVRVVGMSGESTLLVERHDDDD